MILGLDVSTSITGVTILSMDGVMLYNEAWDTRNKNKYPTLYEKADFIFQKLETLSGRYAITDVFIEQSLQSFRSGFSSARTLSTLSRFNGIVSWICFKLFKLEPSLLAASSARKLVGIKKAKGQNSKQASFEFVVDNEPDFVVSYTKMGNLKPGVTDRSDSWVIARAGLIHCKNLNLS